MPDQIIRLIYQSQEAERNAAGFSKREEQRRAQELKAAKEADAARLMNAKSIDAEIAKLKQQVAKGEAAARRDLNQFLRDAERDNQRLARDTANQRKQLDRELNSVLKESERDQQRMARETAAQKRVLDRELNSLLKETAQEQATAAREAAKAQQQAETDEFRKWKSQQDERHRIQMWIHDDAMRTARAQAGNWSHVREAIGATTSALNSMGASLSVAGAGVGIATSMKEEFKRAAEFVKKVSEEFSTLQKEMQGIAAMQGGNASNQFTYEQARQAANASIMPQEWAGFQEAFESYAGAQVEGPDAKLGKDDARLYQQHVATFMASKKKNAALGAQLAGALLTNAKGPQKLADMEAQFGRVYKLLDKSQTPVEQLLPQFQQVMASGLSPEEAAQAMAIVGPAAPNEEAVSVVNASRAIREMNIKGTAKEFGIGRGMGTFESFKAFGENIHERRQAMLAAGKTEIEADKDLDELLVRKGVAQDMREARGLIYGFGRQGVERGAFKTFARYAKDTPDDFVASSIAGYERSDAGKRAKTLAREASALAYVGSKDIDIDTELAKSRAQLIVNREYDTATPIAKTLHALPEFFGGAPDLKQTRVNQETVRRLYAQARGKGLDVSGINYNRAMSEHANQSFVNEEVRELLRLLAEQSKQQTEALKEMNHRDGKKPGPPMNAPPAKLPAGGRM